MTGVATGSRRGNQREAEKSRQRISLEALSPREQIPRIINPTPEIGAYRLATLLAPHRSPGVFGKLDPAALWRIAARLGSEGHDFELTRRLRQLSTHQRRALVRACLAESSNRGVR